MSSQPPDAEPWVELRVHGVSGTPPESMLDVDRVRQVAGDEFGRFFRRADRRGGELAEPDGHILEAYHWGQLTSGSWTQALWLLLAPFGLVNAAQFMLERPRSRVALAAHVLAGATLRLVGLALTMLFVLAAAVITMDLWAWQRAGSTAGFGAALAMFGPVALLVVYLALARSQPALNQVVEPLPPASAAPAAPHPSELVRPGFFEGDPDAPALRRLHVGGGLLLVAMLGFAPAAVGGESAGRIGFWAATGLLGVVSLLVVVLGDPEQSAGTGWQRPRFGSATAVRQAAANPVALIAMLVGVGMLVVAVGYVWLFAPEVTGASVPLHRPGIDWACYLVLLTAVGALLGLVVTNAVLAVLESGSAARQHRSFAPYASGMGCTLLAAVGVFLGVGYAGAFGTVVAGWLGTSQRPVEVPELLSRVVYAWGITAFGMLLMTAFAAVRLASRRGRLAERARAEFTDERGRLHVPHRLLGEIASAIFLARLKNSVPAVLLTLVGLGGLLTAFVAYELFPQLSALPSWPRLSGDDPQPTGAGLDWISQSATWPPGDLPVRTVLMALGALTLTGLATALIFLGRTALLGESARRAVNVVWDVISFWPRSAHPFVPAAYSQRAVPDLENRIRWHLDRVAGSGRRLVLCGHSQGSLLSFATLLRLAASPRPADVDRIKEVGLLTFGSQLQVMFSRGFPAYVNRAAIEWLFEQLDGAWRNLYRDTDQLAGPVLSWGHRGNPDWVGRGDSPTGAIHRSAPTAGRSMPDRPAVQGDGRREFGPDWRVLDPPFPVDPDLGTNPLLGLRRHGEYWLDPAWEPALARVRACRGNTL